MNRIKSMFQHDKKDHLTYWFKRIRGHQATAHTGADASWGHVESNEEALAEESHFQQSETDTFSFQ